MSERSHEHRSDNRSQRRSHHPTTRLRGLPDPPERHRARRERRLGGRLPAHRHGRDVRQRARGRRGRPRLGLDRADVFITSKLNNGFHRPDDARTGVRRRRSARSESDYVDLFLIHWPLPTLYDGDYVSTWKTLEEFRRDGRARSIGVSNFQADAPRAPRRRVRRRAGGQPDRAASVLRQRARCAPTAEAHGIATGGVVADRAGQGSRRSGDRARSPAGSAGHRHRSRCAGTSSAATSSSPSRRPRRGSRRTRAVRLRARARRRREDRRARPRRGGTGRARIRTGWPTIPG